MRLPAQKKNMFYNMCTVCVSVRTSTKCFLEFLWDCQLLSKETMLYNMFIFCVQCANLNMEVGRLREQNDALNTQVRRTHMAHTCCTLVG